MWSGAARARVRVGKLPDSEVPVYCLEFNRYFDRPYLYGPPAEGYTDNLERFTFLSRGSLELCKALGFIPDVIHCNDWQTALVPILNGIDTDEWNAAASQHPPKAFTAPKMAGKAGCKAALQKEAGFAVRDDVPLFGVVGRLTSQKGFDVLAHALDRVLGWDAQ